MNFDSCSYEGDYCFVLPAGVSIRTNSRREKIVKTRNGTTGKSKGNGSSLGLASGSSRGDLRSPEDNCPREQMIAEAAYFNAERRGFAPGNEMSDWLQAEADVEALLATRH